MENKYKKITKLVLLLALITSGIKAQLSGSYTIPGSYASIAAAITDLNTLGVSGPVTINVAAAYTETVPVGGFTLNAITGASSANTVIFQKSGAGANPLIYAYATGTAIPSSAVQDGVWKFNGTDFVTIDGIDILDNNAASPATMEFGYGFFKVNAADGCQNNIIQNCTITLNRINNAAGAGPELDGSRGINMVNAAIGTNTTAITTTLAAGSNSNNKFYNNTIQNCNIGISLIGFVDVTPFTFADAKNDIGGSAIATGNKILNFGGGGTTSAAVGIQTLAQYTLNVSYNTINSNNGSGVTHQRALTGIFVNTAVSAGSSINNNTVTVISAGTTQALIGIQNASGATSAANAVNINNNLITNCTYTSATSGVFTGIVNSASSATLSISNNSLSNNSTAVTSGAHVLISNTGGVTGLININNNSINGFTYTAAGPALTEISNSGGAGTASLSISGNSLQAINYSVTASTANIGIINSAATLNQTISNNQFINLNLNTTSSVTFISNNVTIPTGGFATVNSNSIITGFNKGGAGGTVTLYLTSTSPASASGVIKTEQNNNFSNITLTGATTMAGWMDVEGGNPGPTRLITNNVFSNWACGTSAVTAIQTNWGSTGGSISTNTISNITGQGNITAISIGNSNNGAVQTVSNNIITGLVSATTGGNVIGITGGASNITALSVVGNTISTLSTIGASAVNGMNISGGTTVNVYKNKIYDLQANNASGTVNGLLLASATTFSVYNNLIGDLRAPASSAANPLNGINITGGTNALIYFNSVNMGATSTGANFGSSALNAATGTNLDLRNNILVNTSTPAGTGVTAVLRRSSTTLTSYSVTSNNNLFWAGTPTSTTNPILYDGTNTYTTLNLYKALVGGTGRDLLSVTENPPFASTVGSAANFLSLNTGVATQAESGALPIAGIADDYSATVRNVTTPDIGAREGAYTPRAACSGAPAANTTALSTSTIICAGGNAGLAVANSYSTSGITYQWQVSTTGVAGVYTSISNATNVALSATNIATASFFRAVIFCGASSTSATAVQVVVPPAITITPVGGYTVCAGTQVTFTASGTATYYWPANNTIAPSATFIPSGSTIYTVNGTNPPGCNESATVAVVVKPLPPLAVTPSFTSACNMVPTTFSISGATSYTYNGTQLTGTTIVVSASVLTAYSASGTGTNGCIANTGFVLGISPDPSINIAASSGTVCGLAPVHFTATGASSYTWNGGPTVADSIVVNAPNNGIANTFSVSGTDPVTGCFGTQTISVVSNPLPVVAIAPPSPSVCSKSTITLTAGGSSGNTYQWSNGSANLNITSTPTANVSFTLTGTNPSGCANTATVTVVVNQPPAVVVTPTTAFVCSPSTTAGIGVPNAGNFTASGADTYSWSTGDLTAEVAITPSVTSFYNVTGTDVNGCKSKVSISVIVQACTGIRANATGNNGVSIFPNPSNGFFTAKFEFEGQKTIMITNSVGQVVNQTVTENTTESFDLSALSKGIYFVIVSSKEASGNYKIIVE